MYELSELQLIRAELDSVTIKGADAKFLAQLQIKVEADIQEKSNAPKTKK